MDETLEIDNDMVLDDLVGQDDDIEEENEEEIEMDIDDSVNTFEGHKNSVFAITWNPVYKNILASGGQDEKAFIWENVRSYERTSDDIYTKCLNGHEDTIVDVAFNTTGDLLATAGMDGCVKIWKMPDGELVRTLEGPSESIVWIQWHPRGDVIIAGSDDNLIWMWNAKTNAKNDKNANTMQIFTGHYSPLSCGSFFDDGRRIVSGSTGPEDISVRIWNPKNGECITSIQGNGFHDSGINCIDVSQDNTLILTGSQDTKAILSNVNNGKIVGSLNEHSESVESALFVEDDALPLIMTASLDRKVIIWDKTSLQMRHTYEHPDSVNFMEKIKGTHLFMTACCDGCLRLWDYRTDNCLMRYSGFTDVIQCMALSHDQQMIAAGSDDSTVKVFDIHYNNIEM